MQNTTVVPKDWAGDIPDIQKEPLHYVFENLALKHKPNTLWMEFGVFEGISISYISRFTESKVYGFDTFTGLPEKWREGFDAGVFDLNGNMPQVPANVVLVKGLFQNTLEDFMKSQPPDTKIGFIHMDCDLYSACKYVLDTLHPYLDDECIIVFDELVNYDSYETNGEYVAFYEYLMKHNMVKGVDYKWIGMNGTLGMYNNANEKVAVILHKKSE
jgi:hypothetical protein